MHDGTTLIVDVLTLGENSYALSLPAEDLWVAYEVVRRHVDANGVRHYSQMTEAKTTSDGYSFKFDTGDTFTCSSHLDKPTSSTLSDEIGGGSGGGRFIVTLSYDEGTETWSADKTIAECVAAWNAGQTLFAYNSSLAIYIPMSCYYSEETYMEFVTIDGEAGTVSGLGIDADGVYIYGGK